VGLEAYIDIDYANQLWIGYQLHDIALFLHDNLMTWKSKKYGVASKSSVE